MNALRDIASTRARNRVTRLAMIVADEPRLSREELQAELRDILEDMQRDVEVVMALEIRKGGSL